MKEETVLKYRFPEKPIIIDIPEGLEPDRVGETPKWIIHKVPNKVRKICPAAYTPQLVSIGPLHYGKSNLKAMEHYKTKYMDAFLRRKFCNHINEENLIQFMQDRDRLQRIHGSYAVTFEPRSHKYRGTRTSLDMPAPVDDENMRWSDFIRMILRDAFFILELFFRNHEICLPETEKRNEDYIFKSPWLKEAIKQDLILLENQLPYFVLTDLFQFIFNHRPENINAFSGYLREQENNEGGRQDFLIKITCEFFINYYMFGKPRLDPEKTSRKEQQSPSTDSKETLQKEPQPPQAGHKFNQLVTELWDEKKQALKESVHFTDLIRKFMCQDHKFPEDSDDITRCRYSAKQLDNAKVVFGLPEKTTFLSEIKTPWDRHCWWNDQCCNRSNSCCCSWSNSCCCCWWNDQRTCCVSCLKLEIPPLKVQGNTECIFRNIMALEQFFYPDETRICNYIYLLDQLIRTVEDVDFLVDKKIIENWLGSNKAVADLVNKLCDQIVTGRFFYSGICKKLNEHHSKNLNVARSTLRRVYFKDIWTGSSTFLGLVFLVFSGFSVASTIKNLFF